MSCSKHRSSGVCSDPSSVLEQHVCAAGVVTRPPRVHPGQLHAAPGPRMLAELVGRGGQGRRVGGRDRGQAHRLRVGVREREGDRRRNQEMHRKGYGKDMHSN